MVNFLLKTLENSNIFITGSGGVGKSYVIKEVIKAYTDTKRKYIVLGSTGISAVSIGGITLHSFFKFGICKNYMELKRHDRSQKSAINELKKFLKDCELIVIDEISMISGEVFDMIAYRLNECKYSGKIIVAGDFYQLPPIVKKSELPDSTLFGSSRYAFGTQSWNDMEFVRIEMVGSKRTTDEFLYKILSNLRVGYIDENCTDFIRSKIISSKNIPLKSTIIYGRNYEANTLNEKRLNMLKTPLFTSFGKLIKHKENALNDEKIEKWIKTLNILPEFHFKIGAKVIFTANKKDEYYNGEQGFIKEITENDGDINELIIEKNSGDIVYLERASYDYNDFKLKDGEIIDEPLATFYQFPLKLAYAITIHKSQGMSIRNLICDIDHIFENGQLYVALSRAISAEWLSVLYSRAMPLETYIQKIVKIDPEIVKFYETNKFIYIKNQIIE